MDCNNNVPIQDIVTQVASLLSTDYIEKDDPRIDLGVFTDPTIRGSLILDADAKLTFCELVQECEFPIPPDKTLLDRPIYPNAVLVSYEDAGETKIKWTSALNDIGKPIVAGSVSDGSALTSLIAALASYGLIIDSTT